MRSVTANLFKVSESRKQYIGTYQVSEDLMAKRLDKTFGDKLWECAYSHDEKRIRATYN